MYPVKLAGQRVTLREFRRDDLDAACAVVGDDRVTSWLSFTAKDRDATAAMLNGIVTRAQVEPRTEFYLAVTTPADDVVVGFVRLGLDGVQAAKLGYAIGAKHWRRGYARDAARTMLEFGFTELGLHRISAAIGPTNTNSMRLAESLGFLYEGRIRDHVRDAHGWRDSVLYSVLAPEWKARAQGHAA